MVHCLWPVFRPFFGNNLASKPSRKIPTRMAMSVISTVVFVIETSVFSGQWTEKQRDRESVTAFLVPALHVGDSFFVTDDVDLFLFLNWFAVL